MTAPGEEFTELVDANIPRVDLVGKAANGTRFLIAKSTEEGLLQPLVPAEQVAALIAKADGDVAVEVDDLKGDVPGGGTAETLPGSADWEQLDGDTAMNAVAVLGRVKSVLGWLADREAQEVVTGGDGEAQANTWDLSDMACSLDWMIQRLAGFAVGEHMEAEMADELAPVGKAVADVAAPLAQLEALAPVAKAGRVLSSANETAIRGAVDSLQGVLSSLPQAPAAEEPVTKTEGPPAVTTAAAQPTDGEPVDVLAKAIAALPRLTAVAVAEALLAGGRTQDVAKAKGDPQMAVFDAAGKLVGVIDPADLNPIAATEAPTEGDTEDAEQHAEDPADDPAAATAPETPVTPEDGKTIPGTTTVQAPAEDDPKTPAVAKAADPAQLEELQTQLGEAVRKNADLADVVKELEERVEKMAKRPDDRNSPSLNGATGTPGTLTRDSGTPGDQLADLRKAADTETDPVKKAELSKAAFFAEVKSRFA